MSDNTLRTGKKMGPIYTIYLTSYAVQGQYTNIFSMGDALGSADTPRHSIITEISTKGHSSVGEKGDRCSDREPKRERQRGARTLVGASERARGRGETQFLGIFTTSSWRSDIFFLPFCSALTRPKIVAREGAIARNVRYYSLSSTQPCRNRCTTWSRNLCEAFKWRRPYPYRDPRTPRAQ